jgi:hypothetical protein
MSTDKLAQRVGKGMDRRRFLVKVSGGAVAFTFAFLGLSKDAEAHYYHYACCHLCRAPSSCTGACTWCWSCCNGIRLWQCCEVHSSSSYCGSACTSIKCSRARLISSVGCA